MIAVLCLWTNNCFTTTVIAFYQDESQVLCILELYLVITA